MQQTIIETIGLSRIYGSGDSEVVAIKDMTIKIRQGEFVSVVGQSGSGKSTLLNILGGLDTQTHGDYFFCNESLKEMDSDTLASIRNKRIGFIFQNFNLIKQYDAFQNVELPLEYSHIKRESRDEKVRRILCSVGLEHRMHHKPSQLSGGQQQRVAIARALVNDPDLILADEPTGNLDTQSGLEIIEMLSELNNKGKTILLITHDNSIAEMANRIIRIKDGCLEFDKKNG